MYIAKPRSQLLVLTSQQDEVKSQDAVYVLAFSIIMLNTDQHNPQIRVGLYVSLPLSPCTDIPARNE